MKNNQEVWKETNHEGNCITIIWDNIIITSSDKSLKKSDPSSSNFKNPNLTPTIPQSTTLNHPSTESSIQTISKLIYKHHQSKIFNNPQEQNKSHMIKSLSMVLSGWKKSMVCSIIKKKIKIKNQLLLSRIM